MSEVNPNDLTKINSKADIFDLYSGARDGAKSGIEVELSFFDNSKAAIPAMDLSQNAELKGSINGDWVHNEPTSELLEIVSNADSFSEIKATLNDTNNKIKILTDNALKLGLKRSYFQELPEKSADDLLSRIVDVERYKVMYAPYRTDMKECVRYFAICKSNQVSVSPHSMNHMLENVRRLYILAPFLFLLTDNSAGFCEGKPFANHTGMSLRHSGLTEGRGGIPPYVFSAKSGEEFIAGHIDHVMNNPLFMYYDENSKLVAVPSGDWSVNFNALKKRGLNTSSNYYLAQSIMWPDVKIATLKDSEGNVIGHRYEARMFGVGIHQHQSAFIITSALAFNNDFASSVDELLERYGFKNKNLEASYDLLQKSYKCAREHNGKFFDIEYGTGIMAKFAKEFAVLVDDLASDIDMRAELHPVLNICRSGCTDGKVNRILFPELKDIIDFQKNYSPDIFENPNYCSRTLFSKIFKDKLTNACASVCAA